MSSSQVISAVIDKKGLQQDAEGSIKDAFRALLIDRFAERALPASLPVPTPPVFAKLTVILSSWVFKFLSLRLWHVKMSETRQ